MNHGSEWRRWEPHIHAPGTVMNNQFGGPNAWHDYLIALEQAKHPRVVPDAREMLVDAAEKRRPVIGRSHPGASTSPRGHVGAGAVLLALQDPVDLVTASGELLPEQYRHIHAGGRIRVGRDYQQAELVHLCGRSAVGYAGV